MPQRFWCLCLILLSFGFVHHTFAQETINAQIDAEEFAEKSKHINDVEVDFCNKYGEKSIDYDISWGKKQQICLDLTNSSDKDVIVNISFVDGVLTNDEWKNKACTLEGQGTLFEPYVTGYDGKISLAKNESKTVYATVFYPEKIVLSGSMIQGCLTYSLSEDTGAGPTQGFDILIRKAKFITLHIKKAPIFDIRYLGILVIVMVLVALGRRKLASRRTSKGR